MYKKFQLSTDSVKFCSSYGAGTQTDKIYDPKYKDSLLQFTSLSKKRKFLITLLKAIQYIVQNEQSHTF